MLDRSCPLVACSSATWAGPAGLGCFRNDKEVILFDMATLKVLCRRPTPAEPCLYAQFDCSGSSTNSDSPGDETLLLLDRTKVVRLGLPHMQEISTCVNEERVSIPEDILGPIHAELDLAKGDLKKVLYFDCKEKMLCYQKRYWKNPFKFRDLYPDNPVFSATKKFLAYAKRKVCKVGEENKGKGPGTIIVLVPQLDLKLAKNFELSAKRTAHAISVHPCENIAAVADDQGKILILRYGLGTKSKIVSQIYHWHSQPVLSFGWSESGTYLYSGGSENVLVKWNLHECKREATAPRLADSITHICCTETGPVALLGTSIVQRFSHDVYSVCYNRLDIRDEVCFGSQVFWHRPTATLASLSRKGSVLFYDAKRGRCTIELDIIETNRVTGENPVPDDKAAADAKPRICLSADGHSLAVFESGTVRIWKFVDDADKQWQQEAVIGQPHKGRDIHAMTIHRGLGNSIQLVSTGADGCTRLWASRDKHWGLQWTITYKEKMPLSHTMSADQTVLAISHGAVITLWATGAQALKGTFSKGEGPYTSLEFCLKDKPNYLFSAKASQGIVQLWDLLTFECKLSFSAPEAMLSHSITGNILLWTATATYRILQGCKVKKAYEGKASFVLEDDMERPIVILQDNSIVYEHNEPTEPGWKKRSPAEYMYPNMNVQDETDSKNNAEGGCQEDWNERKRDFVPYKPLSHKLSELLEELL